MFVHRHAYMHIYAMIRNKRKYVTNLSQTSIEGVGEMVSGRARKEESGGEGK